MSALIRSRPQRTRPGPAARYIALALPFLAAAPLLACGGDGGGGGGGARQDVTTDASAALDPRSGGMTTAFVDGSDAFSLSARNINHYERRVFADGKELFEAYWTEPGSGDDFEGLGPEFDAIACSLCHVNDGRAQGPSAEGPLPEGTIARISGTADDLGGQLQRYRTDGAGEARVSVRYEDVEGTYGDGDPYTLRRPVYEVTKPSGEPLDADTVLSVRVPQPLIGLGLLEQIPVDDLQELADPDDADRDGISGRMSEVEHLLLDSTVTGRFGWQASQPTVEQQAAHALFHDMGLTSSYFPSHDCESGCARGGTPVTRRYVPDSAGAVAEYPEEETGAGDHEVTDEQLYELTMYTLTLAVPAARDVGDPEVVRGAGLFTELGCASCHAGPYVTEPGPIRGLSDQEVHPRTDLLLHDLGEGMADRTLAGDPVPTEWRTAPLWGIGRTEEVNGHTLFLHDGRARSLAEAILWHGGEAADARDAFRTLPVDDREALLSYLRSL